MKQMTVIEMANAGLLVPMHNPDQEWVFPTGGNCVLFTPANDIMIQYRQDSTDGWNILAEAGIQDRDLVQDHDGPGDFFTDVESGDDAIYNHNTKVFIRVYRLEEG